MYLVLMRKIYAITPTLVKLQTSISTILDLRGIQVSLYLQ